MSRKIVEEQAASARRPKHRAEKLPPEKCVEEREQLAQDALRRFYPVGVGGELQEAQLLWVDYLAELAARSFAADEIQKKERGRNNGEKKKT